MANTTTHADPKPRGTPDGEKGERVSRTSGEGGEPNPNPNIEGTPKGEPKDKGYGRSHGNAPGHEGPSGPGDAPAKVP